MPPRFTAPRATKDMDVFVHAAPDNASNLMRALRRFGAPVSDISEVDFSVEGIVFQLATALVELTLSHASAVLASKKSMLTK